MTKSKNPKDVIKNDFVYQFAASKVFGVKQVSCYAARFSGLYRSKDGGTTWLGTFTSSNLREGLSALAVVVPPDPEDEPDVFVGVNGGILRSSDDGQNWERTLHSSPPTMVSALAISPNFIQDGTLFAGTLEDGVFRSSDRGWQWAAWNFGLMDLSTLCLAISPNFASDEMLFVGTQSGIFRSTNGGRAWREVDLPVGYQAVLSLAFSPDFFKDTTLFAGTEKRGLLRSTDAGQTWVRLGRPALSGPINGIYPGPNFSKKTALLVLEGGILLASRDGGNTWKIWRKERFTRRDITAVYAPDGFGPKASVLVGHVDGTIDRI
jgi:photosystem II stability/assembly factor-like uncharacterized protein